MRRDERVLTAPGAGVSKRVGIVALAAALVVAGGIVVSRQDGLPKQLVEVHPGTRWLVHRERGEAILADAVSGRVVLRISAAERDDQIFALQGAAGAYLVNPTSGQAVTINEQELKLDTPRPVPALLAERTKLVTGVGTGGAVAASITAHEGVLVPPAGDVSAFELPLGTRDVAIGDDGAVWALLEDRRVQRFDGTSTDVFAPVAGASPDAVISAVGTEAVVLDRGTGTVQWFPGGQVAQLPTGTTSVDAVLQVPSGTGSCAWIARADELLCTGHAGIERSVTLDSLSADRGDILAVSGGAAALVRGGTLDVHRLRLANGATERVPFTWTSRSEPSITTDESGVWIDDVAGAAALVVTPNAARFIDKRETLAPLFGADGQPLGGDSGTNGEEDDAAGGPTVVEEQVNEPDTNGQPDPPEATDDQSSAREGNDVAVVVTSNDFDPDGQPIVIVAATQPRSGSVSILNGSTIVYSPRADFAGTDSFDYTISDPDGQTDHATVTIEMIPESEPNRDPSAAPDAASTSPGRSVVVDVLRNDFDPERSQLDIETFVAPNAREGSVERVVQPDGRAALRFTPAPGVTRGQVSFEYVAADADGGSSEETTVTVTVGAEAENRPPDAVPDSARLQRGDSLDVDVLANDTDDDADTLFVESAALRDARHGRLQFTPGLVRFAPAGTAPDLVLINYVVADGNGGTDNGELLVHLIEGGGNSPPLAVPDHYDATGGRVLEPTRNDSDPDDDPLTIVGHRSPPSGGTVSQLSPTELRFEPEPGRFGTVNFTYTISDGHGHTSTAQITVDVLTASDDANAPLARNDVVRTEVDLPVTVDVLANDTDPLGSPLTVDPGITCAAATCARQPDQSVLYTPPAGRSGTFYFVYRIRNADGATDDAVVTVHVDAVASAGATPEPLIAQDDQAAVEAGTTVVIPVLDNDELANTGTLRLSRLLSTGSLGTARVSGSSITYTAGTEVGTDTFGYEVTRDGQTDTAEVRVTINPSTPQNLPPIAEDDSDIITLGDPSPSRNVVLNDRDPDDDQGTLVLLQGTAGIVSGQGQVVTAGANTLKIVPSNGFVGSVVASYTVADPDGATDVGRYTLVVQAPANEPPTAADDAGGSTPQGSDLVVNVLANDTDPEDGAPVDVQITASPGAAVGTVTNLGGGQVRFVPAPAFSGPATFRYRAVDSDGATSNEATVTITVVACIDTPPSAPDLPNLFTPYGTPLDITLLGAGQTSFSLAISGVSGGTVTDLGVVGQRRFTPTPGSNGGGQFTYTVTNSCSASTSGLVSIDVNRNPVFSSGTFTSSIGVPVSVPISLIATDDEVVTITGATPASVATITGGGTALSLVSATAGTFPVQVTVSDPGGLTATGTVTLVVSAVVNQPPVANNDAVTMTPGSIAVNVTGNDVDPDGPSTALTVVLVSDTSSLNGGSGSVTAVVTGQSVTITASAGNGTATLSYFVRDAAGAESNVATINVLVNRPPNAMVVDGGILGPGDNGLENLPTIGVDPDGNPVSFSNAQPQSPYVTAQFTSATHIAWVVASDTPIGTTIQILFTITDSWGATALGTLTFRVLGVGP